MYLLAVAFFFQFCTDTDYIKVETFLFCLFQGVIEKAKEMGIPLVIDAVSKCCHLKVNFLQ